MKIRKRLLIFVALAAGLIVGSAHAALFESNKFTAPDAAGFDLLGYSIAVQGSTLLASAHGKDSNGNDAGAAYLLDSGTGAQIAKLTASDGAHSDAFGFSVAMDGGKAVVGAIRDDGWKGSAYIFDTSDGSQLAKLTPDGFIPSETEFGHSVAISGDTIVVGAHGDDDNGSRSGSIFLFDANSGSQLAKLTPSDGDQYDYFGQKVAISGNLVLASAPSDENGGSVYVFDATTGAELAKLTASDADNNDRFGSAVAISGDTIVIGAKSDADKGANSGSAYIFDATNFAEVAKLVAPDGAASDFFGQSVAVSGNTVVVDATLHDTEGDLNRGAVYVFEAGTGAFIDKLIASDGGESDFLGSGTAIDGDTIYVGAYGHNHSGLTSAGAVYVYDNPLASATSAAGPASVPLLFIGLVGLIRCRMRHA